MATDDERRCVAERLRSLRNVGGCVTNLNHGFLWSLLWAVSGKELSGSARGDWFERFCARMADLIDPGDNVKCVAEVKVDGEQLEKLVHEAVVELAGVDREALLALADELMCDTSGLHARDRAPYTAGDVWAMACRIREALGVES